MDQLQIGLRETESPFEAEVLTLLSSRGYRVRPQWPVGAYRIDLVVEGNGRRLAVECDGERWHYDKVEEDLARQALLERLGWTFVRLRGSTFYRDRSPHRAEAMKPVFDKLNEFGIQPIGQDQADASPVVTELLESIRRRAFEISNNSSSVAPGSTASGSGEPTAIVVGPPSISADVERSTEPSTNEQRSVPVDDQQINQSGSQLVIPTIMDIKPSPAPKASIQFKKGMRIRHVQFGVGTIVAVRSFGDTAHELELKIDGEPSVRVVRPNGKNIDAA
jgi:very-short-patch-repair endonuclease